jgi:hypothetical protein
VGQPGADGGALRGGAADRRGTAPDPAQQKEAQARALPQLNRPQVKQSWQAALSPATRAALDRATTPQEWNAYFLAAPEFMVR